MNKWLVGILCTLFPWLAFASGSSISFAPPPGDFSVVFLGNIFGIVDGVLSGTGSQIMGQMFAIFNAAVLALGGIVIVYTLLISTLNTAHEGQMLGQKWNSIWVPIRTTLGLALLIPKASGYCLMQIFVMWVVLQGVGAADKVWQTALDYLNGGGFIVQQQMNPITSIMGDKGSITHGAANILIAQVCMLGLQTALEQQRQGYLDRKKQGSGPCTAKTGVVKTFCSTPVPDFLSTVDIASKQSSADPKSVDFSIALPDLSNGNVFYKPLTGICGTLTWNAILPGDLEVIKKNIPNAGGQLESVRLARVKSLQAMYNTLAEYARIMVKNNTLLNPPNSKSATLQTQAPPPYKTPFGVPQLATGKPCINASPECVSWGPGDTSNQATLFGGPEFQGAIGVYNGNMLAALNLINQAKNDNDANKKRDFIKKAETQGWIMAGSYFIDLAHISQSSATTANLTDSNTGLDGSKIDIATMGKSFSTGPEKGKCGSGTSGAEGGFFVCELMNGDPSLINALGGLINGNNAVSFPGLDPTTEHPATKEPDASTVYGFINNQIMVSLPGQPGIATPPKFALKINLAVPAGGMETKTFTGHWYYFWMDWLIPEVFYNFLLVSLVNLLLVFLVKVINLLLLAFLSLPLQGIAKIFIYNVAFIQQPSVNPIIALSNMGVNYINFASEMWVYLIALAAAQAAIANVFGLFILVMVSMVMPLLATWLGVMIGIGFITAYYIPFLPYMIFTFGSIAWLMSVIEAMVAAPIVALGVTHPEGEGAFGKGEHAIMIIMNVFLRPSMMIIGYIAAIALSYVSVWIINAGFYHVVTFIQGNPSGGVYSVGSFSLGDIFDPNSSFDKEIDKINKQLGYVSWAGVYGFFFSIIIYTMLYLTVVQKAFTLITYLPDKVLRWIGGQPEGIGQEATQWAEETKSKVGEVGKETYRAQQIMGKQAKGEAMKKMQPSKTDVSAESGKNKPDE